jgi:SsrA-binding protein
MTVTAGDQEKLIAVNRKAYHDYHVEETIEVGMVLTGTEIKSVRAGRVNLREAYARIENGEAWLLNCHIAPYEQGNRYNHEPTRKRKLLLHREQINRLQGKVNEKGLTLVPLRLYIRNDVAKIALGLVRGKKLYDKREVIAKRDAAREVERDLAHAGRR